MGCTDQTKVQTQDSGWRDLLKEMTVQPRVAILPLLLTILYHMFCDLTVVYYLQKGKDIAHKI